MSTIFGLSPQILAWMDFTEWDPLVGPKARATFLCGTFGTLKQHLLFWNRGGINCAHLIIC